MRELTERQRKALAFLAAYQDAHGVPPTMREILRELGTPTASTTAAAELLEALAKRDLVDPPVVPNTVRGWSINARGRREVGAVRKCPHCGGELP